MINCFFHRTTSSLQLYSHRSMLARALYENYAMRNTRCFLFLYYRLVSRKKSSIWMTLLRKVSSKTSRAFSLCCTVAAVSSSKNGSLQKSSTARSYHLVASSQARAQKMYRFSHQAELFSFLDSRKKRIKAYSARFAHRSTKTCKMSGSWGPGSRQYCHTICCGISWQFCSV